MLYLFQYKLLKSIVSDRVCVPEVDEWTTPKSEYLFNTVMTMMTRERQLLLQILLLLVLGDYY